MARKLLSPRPKSVLVYPTGTQKLTRPAPELPREFARHHADHGEVRAIDADGPAHQRRVAAISRLPQSVAEDHFVILAQGLFLGKERAAEKGLGTQHGKEARGYAQSRDLFRLLADCPSPRDYSPCRRNRRWPCFQRSRLCRSKIPEVGRGDDVPIVGTFAEGFPHQHQAVRAGNGSGFNSVLLITLKMVVLAPMPSARVSIATSAKPGFRARFRKP